MRRGPASTWVEAVWLLTAVCVPCWMMPFAWSAFELPKAVIVRSMGALALLGVLIWAPSERGRLRSPVWSRLGRNALVLAALGFVGSYALSTGFSLVRQFSVNGAPTRGGGLLTQIGATGLFLAVAAGIRRREQVERLLTAISLSAFAVAGMAALESAGMSLSPATLRFGPRVFSFLGNPIFLGSYVVVTFPIVLWAAVSRAGRRERLPALAHGLTALLQLWALWQSGSRGPWLAWGFSAYLGFLLIAMVLRYRRLTIALSSAGLLAMAGVLVMLHVHFPDQASTERLSHSTSGVRLRTVAVRFDVYQTISRRMLSREPIAVPGGPVDPHSQWRTVVGFGPQTLAIALDRFFPASLERIEGSTSVIDSAHSRLLEVWTEQGILGLAAYLLLFTAVMYAVFDGLWRSAKQRHLKALTTCIVISVAIAEACLTRWWGLWAWGLAVTMGVVTGFMLYALVSAISLRPRAVYRPARWRLGLHVALGMAMAGFFVETQFGLETVTPALMFWLLLGVLAALKVNPELGLTPGGSPPGREDAAPEPERSPRVLMLCLAVLLFVLNNSAIPSPDNAGTWQAILHQRATHGWGWLLLGTTCIGGCLIWGRSTRRRLVLPAMAVILVATLGHAVWLSAYIASHLSVVYTNITAARGLVTAMQRMSTWPVLLLPIVAAVAGVRLSLPPRRRTCAIAAGAAGVVLILTHLLLLPPVRAEVAYSIAQGFTRHERVSFGPQLVKEAARGGPWDDTYLCAFHRIQGERAIEAADATQRDAGMRASTAAMQAAIDLVPFDARHYERMATARQIWLTATNPPPSLADRKWHLQAARQAYETSLSLAPGRTSVSLKYANLLLQGGQVEPALGALHTALKRDPANAAVAEQLARIYDVLAQREPTTATGQGRRRRATYFAEKARSLAPAFGGDVHLKVLESILKRAEVQALSPEEASASLLTQPETPAYDRVAAGEEVFVVLPFLLALFAAWLLTPLMRRIALRINLVDRPEGRKAHIKVTPLMGGVAVYLSIILASVHFGHTWPPTLRVLLGAATLLMLTGLLDDRFTLGWRAKLGVQVGVTIWLYAAGLRVQLHWLPVWLNVIVSSLWLIGITNAVNFLDNMNGLSSGIALIGAAFFALMGAMNDCLGAAVLAAAVSGAALGFLRFNRPRALIFLGDAGSLLLGLMLAGLGLELRFLKNPNYITWMVPVLVLGLPVFDMTLVCISRLRHGLNPLATPGHDHTSHRLARILGSRRRAVAVSWCAALLCGTLGMLVMNASVTTAYLVLGGFLAIFVGLLIVAETRYPASYPEFN